MMIATARQMTTSTTMMTARWAMTLADGILPFMESGWVGNVTFTQQSNDQAWVDEFWGGKQIA